MGKIILSANSGSSSVKISVYQTLAEGDPKQIADAQVAGLSAPPATLTYSASSQKIKDQDIDETIKNQDDAFKFLLKHLIDDKELKEVAKPEDVSMVCHRVVHGGDYEDAQVITSKAYHHIEKLTDLAPLHNAPALEIIKSCMNALPKAVNVACFDSQFHQTMSEAVRTYPIDQKHAKANGLRKYGFHGISYSFITRAVATYLHKAEEQTNIIALHLGSGASACAVKNGKSINTSMGLTPLSGLPGATRSGDVDPSLVFHYADNVGALSPSSTKDLHISKAEEILNKNAGWNSLTGTSDFGTISSSSESSHKLAFDLFVDRICAFVGSYYVALEGKVDALVFAGGIGEKSVQLRNRVVEQCACLGFAIDNKLNESKLDKSVAEIGSKGARHRTLVCHTDEQFEMARMCANRDDLQ